MSAKKQNNLWVLPEECLDKLVAAWNKVNFDDLEDAAEDVMSRIYITDLKYALSEFMDEIKPYEPATKREREQEGDVPDAKVHAVAKPDVVEAKPVAEQEEEKTD